MAKIYDLLPEGHPIKRGVIVNSTTKILSRREEKRLLRQIRSSMEYAARMEQYTAPEKGIWGE